MTDTPRLPCTAWIALNDGDWQLRTGMFLASANDETGGWVVLLLFETVEFTPPPAGRVFGDVKERRGESVILADGATRGRLAAEDWIAGFCRHPLAMLER